MAKKEKKQKMSKLIAILFVVLMLGTTIAMFVDVFLKPSDKVEIPQNRVIHYQLTEAQVKALISNYQTVLEYEYPSGCLKCGSLLTTMEQWTMSSDNQMYLQEIQKDTSSSSKLTITSLRGQKILYDPTQEDARNDICEMLISRSLFCVEV